MTINIVETWNVIQNFFTNVGMVTGAIMFLSMPILYIVVGYPFDKMFKEKAKQDITGIINPGIIIINEVKRALAYAVCIAFYWRFRNPKAKMIYNYDAILFDNYDFKANASWLQIVVSNFFIYNFIVCATSSIIAAVPPWLKENFLYLKSFF
jgi:hypothetical protein